MTNEQMFEQLRVEEIHEAQSYQTVCKILLERLQAVQTERDAARRELAEAREVIAAQAEKFAAQDDPRPCCGHANRFHDDVAFAEGVEAHACVHCAWLSAREDAERYKDALNRIIGVPLGTSAEARKVWDIATSALDPAPPAPAPAKPRRMMPNDVTIHCSVEHDEDEYCRLNGCKPIGGENA